MIIRRIEINELPQLETLAQQFYASSEVLTGFDIAKFAEVWQSLLSQGVGVIFVVDSGAGLIGALGAVAYPDLYSAGSIATEMFWFVDPAYRGMGGTRLYYEFEQWAKDRRCSEVRMVHLVDSMPEKLSHFYTSQGYKVAETHYRKVL